jgi:hypothetical protein
VIRNESTTLVFVQAEAVAKANADAAIARAQEANTKADELSANLKATIHERTTAEERARQQSEARRQAEERAVVVTEQLAQAEAALAVTKLTEQERASLTQREALLAESHRNVIVNQMSRCTNSTDAPN